MVYAMYIVTPGEAWTSAKYDNSWFGEDYNLDNIKYFIFDREYIPKNLTNDPSYDEKKRNATDGFAMVANFVRAGFKNLNIIGFSAFGSDEDQSYHTAYGSSSYAPGDHRLAGQKYFDIDTSEDQRTEADILQLWTQTKKIKNVENYSKLISYREPLTSSMGKKYVLPKPKGEICMVAEGKRAHHNKHLEYNGQAFADKFVLNCTGFKRGGYFLELGSRHAKWNNNSYILEKNFGWRGIMVDRDGAHKSDYESQRPNSIPIIKDATQIDYKKVFEENNFPANLDFWQLDLEVRDNTALSTFLKIDEEILEYYKFAVITMEHDIYTGFANAVNTRVLTRKTLENRGYYCVFEDILDPPDIYLTVNVEGRSIDCFKSYEIEY